MWTRKCNYENFAAQRSDTDGSLARLALLPRERVRRSPLQQQQQSVFVCRCSTCRRGFVCCCCCWVKSGFGRFYLIKVSGWHYMEAAPLPSLSPFPPPLHPPLFFPSFYLSRRYLVHFASSFVPYIQIVKFLEPRRNLYTNCWHSLRTDATRPDVYLKWRWERDGLRVQQPGRARALISRFQFHIYIYIPALVLFWYAIRRSLAIRSQHAVQFPQVEFSLSLGYCLQILLLCVAASIISLPLVKSVGAARPFPSFHYSDCRSLCHSTGGLASSVPREILLLLFFFFFF